MASDVTFRVRTESDQEISVTVPVGSTFAEVTQQVRQLKCWAPDTHIRLLCAGRELHAGDPVTAASSHILHCVGISSSTLGPTIRQSQDIKQQDVQQDWLDVMDPGTVLMWIFGSILALLWLLFVIYAHMFDRTSVIMLCLMTIAFLIPCALSYLPAQRLLSGTSTPLHSRASTTPSFSSGVAPQQQHQQWRQQGTGRPMGPARQQQQQQQQAGEVAWCASSAVPPRPHARRPPAA